MKTKHLVLIGAAILLFTACAPSVNIDACIDGKTYGFLHGLWHGIIAPIDLIAMLISDKYTVFAANNNGFGYAFGFLLGSGGWGVLGSKARRR